MLNASSISAYELGLWIYAAATLATFGMLSFISAPYGRHTRNRFGPMVNATYAWCAMEAPALIVMPYVLLSSAQRIPPASLWLMFLWCAHYFNRALVYPWPRHSEKRMIPVLIPMSASIFNIINGYTNGHGLAISGYHYGASSVHDFRFATGVVIFFLGAGINIHSDAVLLRLRKERGTGYHLPTDGLHRMVAAPNYLGEILLWFGWAIAAWTTAGFLFAAYTMANLAPRARDHLKWYLARFPEYPTARKALIPFVW